MQVLRVLGAFKLNPYEILDLNFMPAAKVTDAEIRKLVGDSRAEGGLGNAAGWADRSMFGGQNDPTARNHSLFTPTSLNTNAVSKHSTSLKR